MMHLLATLIGQPVQWLIKDAANRTHGGKSVHLDITF